MTDVREKQIYDSYVCLVLIITKSIREKDMVVSCSLRANCVTACGLIQERTEYESIEFR